LRPTDLASRLGVGASRVSNLARSLEGADLIVRRRAGGRETWIFPTPRALKVAPLLRDRQRPDGRASGEVEVVPAAEAPLVALWHHTAFESTGIPDLQVC